METLDVEKIAEAVLYEGYLLFPYRRSALKNQKRWTFGGVYPRAYSEATGGNDPWLMQTQCLVAGDEDTEFEIKIRFLHVAERKVAQTIAGSQRFVEELRVGGQVYRPWEEAIERERLLGAAQGDLPLRLGDLLAAGRWFGIDVPAGSEAELLRDPAGVEAGTILREWRSLQGAIEISAKGVGRSAFGVGEERTIESLEEPLGLNEKRNGVRAKEASLYRLTVRIVNTTPWSNDTQGADPLSATTPQRPTTARNDASSLASPPCDNAQRLTPNALHSAFVSTHTILRVRGGEFVSLLDPPDGYQQAAAECENIKTWPVLVGGPGERHTMLSSPIILYDYPQISPESQGNFFDATEIDELLTLSVLTLTEEEKQEMRDSDVHGREILARTEALSEEQIRKMHGAIRTLKPLKREEA